MRRWSRDGLVAILITPQAWHVTNLVSNPSKVREIFFLFQRAVNGFGTHPASYSVHTGAGGVQEAKGVNFTSRHCILLHLIMSGTTPPLPNTPSCRAQWQFEFHVASCMSDISLDDEKRSNRNSFQCYVIRPFKEVNKAGTIYVYRHKKVFLCEDFRYSQRCLWSLESSVMLLHVDWEIVTENKGAVIPSRVTFVKVTETSRTV